MANPTNPPISLVIFDCDGVVVDSEPVVMRVLTEHMRAIGVDITYEDCGRDFVGLSNEATTQLIEDRRGAQIPDGWDDSLSAAIDAAPGPDARPIDGVLDVIAGLALPYCVASNGRLAKLEITPGAIGLLDRLRDRIFAAADVARQALPRLVFARRSHAFDPPHCPMFVARCPVSGGGL